MRFTSGFFAAAALSIFISSAFSQPAPTTEPYKVITTDKVGGDGSWDYVFADSVGRKLYIPRSARPDGRVTVFDLDTLKPLGEIPKTDGVHGVAVDPKTKHGFVSCNPVVMFDTDTLATIKTIDVDGNPDGIFFEPATERIYVLSHSDPNVTVINAADGTVAGTIDLGGSPEQGASDGAGHVYIDLEDKDAVAVVDANTMKLVTTYDISSKGGGPGGLGLDAKNHIIFSFCHDPATCVILSADDGKILDTLPIGAGVDAAEFDANTMEAFSSQGDGTLTIIKEDSPTSFEVEQTVQTKAGARTSTLDSATDKIFLITADRAPSSRPATTQPQAGGRRRGGRGGAMVPGSFTILVVGK